MKANDESKTPLWAKNQTELATFCGVSRKTIQRATAVPGWPKPAANGKWNVARCQAFLRKHFDVLEESGQAVPEGFTSWREYGDAVKAQRDAIRLAKERGEVCTRAFVAQVIQRGGNALCHELQRVFCAELPGLLAGQDAITIEAKLSGALHRATQTFRDTIRATLDQGEK